MSNPYAQPPKQSHTGKIILIVGLILLIIAAAITAIVIILKKGGSKPSPSPSTPPSKKSQWDAIKKAWPSKQGEVLLTVLGASPSASGMKSSIEWITDTAKNPGAMTAASAKVVCEKACDGWKNNTTLKKYCDCSTETAKDF